MGLVKNIIFLTALVHFFFQGNTTFLLEIALNIVPRHRTSERLLCYNEDVIM